MAQEDRAALEAELAELREQLERSDPKDGSAPAPELLQAVPEIKRKIAKLEEIFNKDDDLIPHGSEKDVLLKRAREIEAIVRKDCPTDREMALMPKSGMDFERAVQKTMHYNKTHGHLVQEWKEIMTRLEPEDPAAADVRKLMG